ncbi:hypothetical protein HON22_02360 [Candidatus Peregrinibacteria bacterium]|jgi:hypothetical protein|nr:hypothetical protein [Candidatus Peregrinibacteria bacterium]
MLHEIKNFLGLRSQGEKMEKLLHAIRVDNLSDVQINQKKLGTVKTPRLIFDCDALINKDVACQTIELCPDVMQCIPLVKKRFGAKVGIFTPASFKQVLHIFQGNLDSTTQVRYLLSSDNYGNKICIDSEEEGVTRELNQFLKLFDFIITGDSISDWEYEGSESPLNYRKVFLGGYGPKNIIVSSKKHECIKELHDPNISNDWKRGAYIDIPPISFGMEGMREKTKYEVLQVFESFSRK